MRPQAGKPYLLWPWLVKKGDVLWLPQANRWKVWHKCQRDTISSIFQNCETVLDRDFHFVSVTEAAAVCQYLLKLWWKRSFHSKRLSFFIPYSTSFHFRFLHEILTWIQRKILPKRETAFAPRSCPQITPPPSGSGGLLPHIELELLMRHIRGRCQLWRDYMRKQHLKCEVTVKSATWHVWNNSGGSCRSQRLQRDVSSACRIGEKAQITVQRWYASKCHRHMFKHIN